MSTREPGLYTCQISHEEIVTLPLPVESAQHVLIVGDESMPLWTFTGEGPTFFVAVHAYLNLAYMTVPSGQVTLMRGGEVSIDHVQMQRTQLHVAGSLAVSGCELRSDGATVPLAIESGGTATVTSTVFRSTAGDITVVTVAAGGSLTVDSSQLVHSGGAAVLSGLQQLCGSFCADGGHAQDSCNCGVCGSWGGCSSISCPPTLALGVSLTVSDHDLVRCPASAAEEVSAPTQDSVTDPFPCNGANMACTGQHAGSVTVAGPSAINTAVPLVCDAVTGA